MILNPKAVVLCSAIAIAICASACGKAAPAASTHIVCPGNQILFIVARPGQTSAHCGPNPAASNAPESKHKRAFLGHCEDKDGKRVAFHAETIESASGE